MSTLVNLSIFTEVHKVLFYGFEDIIHERHKDKKGNYNQNRFSFGERKVPELYYFMKTADIFPVDISIDKKGPASYCARMRPEFLISYDKPLSSDAFMQNMELQPLEIENDDIEVAEASRYLRKESIQNLVSVLDSLAIIPIDSPSLTQV